MNNNNNQQHVMWGEPSPFFAKVQPHFEMHYTISAATVVLLILLIWLLLLLSIQGRINPSHKIHKELHVIMEQDQNFISG